MHGIDQEAQAQDGREAAGGMAEQVPMVDLSLLGTVQVENIEVEERLLEFGEALQHLEVQAHGEAQRICVC